MSKFRKAVAAFAVGLLALPIANWINGTEVFDLGKLLAALAAAVVAAVAVYFTPNTTP